MCCAKESSGAAGGLLILLLVAGLVIKAIRSAATWADAQLVSARAMWESVMSGALVVTFAALMFGALGMLVYVVVQLVLAVRAYQASRSVSQPRLPAGEVVGLLPVGDIAPVAIVVDLEPEWVR